MSEFKNLFLGLKQPRNEDVLYFPTLWRAVAIMTFQDFILSLMVNSACSNIFWPFLKFENSYHFCSILCVGYNFEIIQLSKVLRTEMQKLIIVSVGTNIKIRFDFS